MINTAEFERFCRSSIEELVKDFANLAQLGGLDFDFLTYKTPLISREGFS